MATKAEQNEPNEPTTDNSAKVPDDATIVLINGKKHVTVHGKKNADYLMSYGWKLA